MTKLESIADIRHTLAQLRRLQERSWESREALEEFQTTYERLLDRFYAENEDVMTAGQYETAGRDIEFFTQIVEAVYLFYVNQEGKGTQGETSMH